VGIMIITKTPFRVSFAGGGTDLREFYSKEEGAVLSTTIDKYMYIAMHRYFEKKIMLKYSKTEIVDFPEQIEHKLIRECFLKTNTREPIEMTSFADIPSSGTGLGSSSAFDVGLLKALYTYKGKNKENITLAEEACEIEIEMLKEPIGKQDQYACAVGGFNLIKFNPDESVFVEPLVIPLKIKRALDENLVMFYTGITRSASSILTKQKKECTKEDKFRNLVKMRDLAFELRDSLISGDITSFGSILNKGWMLKKELASGISNAEIDGYYNKALSLGAAGGKILGAGGGGFFLFYCPTEKQEILRKNLGLRKMKFRFEPQGSRIIYSEDDYDE